MDVVANAGSVHGRPVATEHAEAFATPDRDLPYALRLVGQPRIVAVDGSDEIRRSLTGPLDAPERLGAALAALLLEDGAGALVPDLAPPTSPTGGSTTRTTATPLGA